MLWKNEQVSFVGNPKDGFFFRAEAHNILVCCILSQAMKLSQEAIQENIELLKELMPVRQQWAPEALFNKLGGVQLLSQLIAMSPEWSNYTGK